jgi:hypothetical protein
LIIGGDENTIIQNHVGSLSILETLQTLFNAPNILFFLFSLPSKDRHTSSSNGSSSRILGGENVAGRPGNFCTKNDQSLN